MKKTLSPSRRLPSQLNIHGRVDVDLQHTVQFLKNSGINVTVRNEEPPSIPIIIGKGNEKTLSRGKEKVSCKGKQKMSFEAITKRKRNALTINPPTSMGHNVEKEKEKTFSNGSPTNKRQMIDGCGPGDGKENLESDEYILSSANTISLANNGFEDDMMQIIDGKLIVRPWIVSPSPSPPMEPSIDDWDLTTEMEEEMCLELDNQGF